jgi:hypothetical protein
MKYFSILPQMIVTDPKGNSKVFTNIMARTSIIPSLFQNPLLFYSYDIQDSDTPELIAHKYYGYIERFWMVLFANQILDPQWEWPMNYTVFNKYVQSKYTPEEIVAVHNYQKTITTTDNASGTSSSEILEIDEDTYNNLTESTVTLEIPNGTTVTVSVTKQIIDNYAYEFNLNESRRNIKLINKVYAEQIEREAQRLMGSTKLAGLFA